MQQHLVDNEFNNNIDKSDDSLELDNNEDSINNYESRTSSRTIRDRLGPTATIATTNTRDSIYTTRCSSTLKRQLLIHLIILSPQNLPL